MIEAHATVTEVEPGYAWVETARRTACGECSMRKSCGTAAVGRIFGNRTSRVRAIDGLGVAPGDQVVVGLREETLLSVSSAVYLLPLAGLLAGSLAGGAIFPARGETAAILAGAAGLILGLAVLRRISARLVAGDGVQPVIVRRGEGQPSTPDGVDRPGAGCRLP